MPGGHLTAGMGRGEAEPAASLCLQARKLVSSQNAVENVLQWDSCGLRYKLLPLHEKLSIKPETSLENHDFTIDLSQDKGKIM